MDFGLGYRRDQAGCTWVDYHQLAGRFNARRFGPASLDLAALPDFASFSARCAYDSCQCDFLPTIRAPLGAGEVRLQGVGH